MRGALCSFVGLLLSTTLHFGIAVTWTAPLAVLGLVAFVGLRLRVDILCVVLLATLASAFLR